MRFFTSDLHFNHKKIMDFCPQRIEMFNIDPKLVKEERKLRAIRQKQKQLAKRKQKHLSPRNGKTYEICPLIINAHDEKVKELLRQHNQGIVDAINKIVQKRDTLYIVGDFAFGAIGEAKKWLHKLNGRKILIMGNHDRDPRVMFEMGFKDVFENHQIKLGDHKILLSHFPYFPSLYYRIRHWILYRKKPDKRYLHKRIFDTGQWLLHGHVHSEEVFPMGPRQIHVGIDAWGEPVSEKEILSIIDKS